MGTRYETGTKNHVIMRALYHAIDERESMVDGYSNRYYDSKGDLNDPITGHEFRAADLEYINGVKAEIRDFKKMFKSLRGE